VPIATEIIVVILIVGLTILFVAGVWAVLVPNVRSHRLDLLSDPGGSRMNIPARMVARRAR
jgi:hypothetical protein